MFNNNQVNARKCAVVLTKVLYLLNHVRHCFKLLEGRGKKLKRERDASRTSCVGVLLLEITNFECYSYLLYICSVHALLHILG